MTWNNPVIDGTKSVKFNKTAPNENTNYIETNMQLDHFWDEDANEDGHHRQIQMPKQATDPSLATDMDGAFYFKEDANSETLGYYRNSAQGVRQVFPAWKSGTTSIGSTTSWANLTNAFMALQKQPVPWCTLEMLPKRPVWYCRHLKRRLR